MGTTAWRIFATKGCGSAIVEAAFEVANVPYERIEAHYGKPEGRAMLLEHNPLAQVPTVIAPDGVVLTESAAIIQILDELVPSAELLPHAGDLQRREALRYLTFLVAAVYPTFTYGDEPEKWNADARLRASTDAHREALWRHLEGVAQGPWFLGARRSALDLYISVMSRWRPRRLWFAEHVPTLHAIAVAIDADPRLAGVWAANFA